MVWKNEVSLMWAADKWRIDEQDIAIVYFARAVTNLKA